MDIHNYHPVTGEYLSTTDADVDPLTPGSFLIPANATTDAPPTQQQGQARVLVNGAWTLVPDHRGETWWSDWQTPVVIDELGTPAPELSLTQPATPPPSIITVTKAGWLRAALARQGKLSAVNAAVAQTTQEKQELWEYATEYRIDDADVVAIAAALNINLRELFDLAETIRVERQG